MGNCSAPHTHRLRQHAIEHPIGATMLCSGEDTPNIRVGPLGAGKILPPQRIWSTQKTAVEDGVCCIMRARAPALLRTRLESLTTLVNVLRASDTECVGVGTGTAKAA